MEEGLVRELARHLGLEVLEHLIVTVQALHPRQVDELLQVTRRVGHELGRLLDHRGDDQPAQQREDHDHAREHDGHAQGPWHLAPSEPLDERIECQSEEHRHQEQGDDHREAPDRAPQHPREEDARGPHEADVEG